MLADRVALLEEGVTAVGTHSELLRTSEHYRHVISSLEDAEAQENTRLRETEVNLMIRHPSPERPVKTAPTTRAASARSASARCACSARSSTAAVAARARPRRAGRSRPRCGRRPGLIAYGLNTALRALQDADWMPTIVIVVVPHSPASAVPRSSAGTRCRRAPHAGRHARPAQAHLPAHAAAQPRVPRVVHVGPHHLASDERPRLDPRAPRRGPQRARLGRPLRRFTLIALLLLDWQSGAILLVGGIPLYFLMRWFYRGSQRAYRESRVVSAKVIVKFVETMTGIRAVKAFRKERATTRSSATCRASTATSTCARCACSGRSSRA
jgi:hypothetical protein